MKAWFAIPFLIAGAARADACMDLVTAKQIAADHHGRWIDLTETQWTFLRGVFYGLEKTPNRLPFGSGAAVVKMEDGSAGAVFFLDGDRACDTIVMSQSRLSVLGDIGAGVTTHEDKVPGDKP